MTCQLCLRDQKQKQKGALGGINLSNNVHKRHRNVIYSLNFFIVGLANNIRIKKCVI